MKMRFQTRTHTVMITTAEHDLKILRQVTWILFRIWRKRTKLRVLLNGHGEPNWALQCSKLVSKAYFLQDMLNKVHTSYTPSHSAIFTQNQFSEHNATLLAFKPIGKHNTDQDYSGLENSECQFGVTTENDFEFSMQLLTTRNFHNFSELNKSCLHIDRRKKFKNCFNLCVGYLYTTFSNSVK